MAFDVEINDEELVNLISNAAYSTLDVNIPQHLEKACMAVQAKAMELCPVSTGTLRESIQTAIQKTGSNVDGYIGSNVEYAPYVHQGTGIYAAEGNGRSNVPWRFYSNKQGSFITTYGIEPIPFLQMAVDNKRDELLEYFYGALSNGSN